MNALGIDRTRLYADANTVTAEGCRNVLGERVDAARLHAASTPAGDVHDRRSGLVIADVDLGAPGKPPRSLHVVLHPLERDVALRIDDVYGKGMAADGYTTESRLDRLAPGEPATGLLREAGAHWLIEAAQASADDGERMRAVLRAAWQAGVAGLGREAVAAPHPPEDVVHSRLEAAGVDHPAPASEAAAAPRHGWWAPPGGPALWFETSTLDIDELGADIATIASAMHANRAIDGVPDAEHVLLLPFASNHKLRMIWFNPELGETLGADEYTLVLRVPDDRAEDFDADDFEQLCLDAGLSATTDLAEPILHFLWEFGDEPRRLTW